MENKELKTCPTCENSYPPTNEYFHKEKFAKGGLRRECKVCRRVKVKKYQINHKPRAAKYAKYWRTKNDEHYTSYRKEYEKSKREHLNSSMVNWRKSNKKEWKNISQRSNAKRKTIARDLPNNFTEKDLVYLEKYFNNACVVCGSQSNLHLDHWIPLSSEKCPGTVANNMMLLCKSCNSSKKDKLPRTWLVEKFGEEKYYATLFTVIDYFARV